MPSWQMVLDAIDDAWMQRREQIAEQTPAVIRALGASARIEPSMQLPAPGKLSETTARLLEGFDVETGGWGRAPKFPQASAIEFLLARGEAAPALSSLRAMAAGGIYDQVGGGFARYSVDARWTVPHFEKMLYDNALLARAYLHGWQVSGEERFADVCRETLDWALREMRGPEGGFCCALDADSEGVEGKFYVWTVAELRAALGGLADEAIAYFGATEGGNFEDGANVLEARGPVPAQLQEVRRELLAARGARTRPGLDDKRLTGWNALMIAALADAGAVLGRADYLDAARSCAAFVLSDLRDGDGRLLRTWKDGQGRLAGYLEDYALQIDALLTLYEATFEPRWYGDAVSLADTMIDRFADPERGGFFTTASDRETLVARRKDLDDTPLPSGNSAAAMALQRLARLSGEDRFEDAAVGVLRLLGGIAVEHPLAFAHLLRALDFQLARVREVAIVGEGLDGGGPLTQAVRARFRPHLVLAGGEAPASSPPATVPLLVGRGLLDGRPAAYVCEHFACQAPVADVDSLLRLLA
jgi:uncharacterized protein YyaL (SSP411 family)